MRQPEHAVHLTSNILRLTPQMLVIRDEKMFAFAIETLHTHKRKQTHSHRVVDGFPVQRLSLLCVVFYSAINHFKLKLLWLLYSKHLIFHLSLLRFLWLPVPIFHFRSLLRLQPLPRFASAISLFLLSLPPPYASLALARARVLSLSLSLSLAAALLPPPSTSIIRALLP